MKKKVLFVDDDKNLLMAFRRVLRKHFDLDTAYGGREGLDMMAENGPYAVVVSDLQMPVMNGLEFLRRAKAADPDCVCIMLTGNADLQTAIEALNQGNIFRFLLKPCEGDVLVMALMAGLEQHGLIQARKELLEQTLRGTVQVLTEVVALAKPDLFEQASRIQRFVREIAIRMSIPDIWAVETAAMLCNIGSMLMVQDETDAPPEAHGALGARLIRRIPRMAAVADIVQYQAKHHDGGGYPEDAVAGKAIPFGARILKCVIDYDRLTIESAESPERALFIMKDRRGQYDPDVLAVLAKIAAETDAGRGTRIPLSDIQEGMVLGEDLKTPNGRLLLSRGREINRPVIERLRFLADTGQCPDQIAVLKPAQ